MYKRLEYIYKKLDEDKYLITILFILAFIVRGIVFVQNGNHPADGIYRIILAMNWLKDPYFITGGLWPPLHLYIMAFAMRVWNDPISSSRLVSLILGTIIIFPYYYLIKSLFDKRTAMISSLILAFLGVHIQYSTFSMSEVPSAFFLITSLYFFFRFKDRKRMIDILMSAIFINLASMMRYEVWLFIPLLAIFMLDNILININIRNLKNYLRGDALYLFIFITVSMIFPVLWMIGNYNMFGDPFYIQEWTANFIRTDAIIHPDSIWHNPPIIRRLIAWPGEILLTLNIVSIFAGIGLLVSLWKKKNLEFFSIFFILMMTFIYQLFNFKMSLQTRYIIMPILFLIPYFTIGIDYLLKNINKDLGRIFTVIIIVLFITTSSYTVITKMNMYKTPDYIFDVSNWLKNNVKSDEKILLDEYNWRSLDILFYSGFNTTFTEDYLKTVEFTTDQIRIVPGGGKEIDEGTVTNYLENYRPSYLVYSPQGRLTKILNFSVTCQNETYLNYYFECKYTTENYNIYKLKKL